MKKIEKNRKKIEKKILKKIEKKIITKEIEKKNIELLNDKRYFKNVNLNEPHTLYIE